MFARTRLIVRFTLAVLSVPAATVLAHPPVDRPAIASVWQITASEPSLAAEAETAQVLADRDDEVMRRIAVKETLVAELIAGRSTLAEVTTEFLSMDEQRPDVMTSIRSGHPGDTDQERMAHNVIDYTLPRVADEDERDELSQRLEAELARMHPTDY